MPSQTPIDRESLKLSLEERYKTQKVGGSFDAKSIQTEQGKRMPIYAADGISAAISEAKWTNPNFDVKMPMMGEEFSEQALNFLDSTGFSNKKYKP